MKKKTAKMNKPVKIQELIIKKNKLNKTKGFLEKLEGYVETLESRDKNS